jgi:glutamate-1-semialdehyde 2,1-aminomutase
VYQAGTLSGNPLATAAGLAALALLDDGAYARLEQIATRLADGLTAAFAGAGVTAQVPRARTLVGLFFSDEPVRDFDGARAADHTAYASFFHGCLDRGVYLAPSGYEAMFPSLAHGDAELDHTLDTAAAAADGD